ncbi:3-hydroxyacyl-CoA dehydrogenase family protein [Sporomusa termitida]|uniref:3-hydroxyacyl-CoA dehydrogenase family protein n=1 Tax=Sporomusa termitida TaxID=2377 RepID=UPI001FE684C6|nr:3-hydroxyacyl-CoA dehydrogenase family protein [Sporomusa termitida]
MAILQRINGVVDLGVASVEKIDCVAKLGFAQPTGPLALSDLIGNDTVLSIMEVLYNDFSDPKYRLPVAEKMAPAGYLGVKRQRLL